MNDLELIIKKILPDAIREINEIRLPALEMAWGRSFKEEMNNEDQVTVEISKNYSRVLNNCLYRHIRLHTDSFIEHTTNGSDYSYNGILIEDKNSFSENNSWVGNGFNKTPIHLLKKFVCDENGRIIKAFVAIVDLAKCNSGWSGKTLSTNRSTITFSNSDIDNIHVIYGDIKVNRKNLKPILMEI